MRLTGPIATLSAALVLSACAPQSEPLAEEAEKNFEAAAEAREALAVNSADPSVAAERAVEAEEYRQMGEGKAEAIRAADPDPALLNTQQRRDMTAAPR